MGRVAVELTSCVDEVGLPADDPAEEGVLKVLCGLVWAGEGRAVD